MPMDLVTIPCRSDNYAYLFHDAASGETALIDIPEAQPILDELLAAAGPLAAALHATRDALTFRRLRALASLLRAARLAAAQAVGKGE